MSIALLVDFFNQLPDRLVRSQGTAFLRPQEGGKPPRSGPPDRARARVALDVFKKQVSERYNEGTLLRLLDSPDVRSRRAAVFALGLLGTMAANTPLAARLHDEDGEVAGLSADALWSVWFRADSPANNEELERLVRLRDREKALTGLDRLLEKAPTFAEAYNQRALVAFRLKQYERSIADCERVLRLNPHHFGAQAGIGQCFLQMRKNKPALKAFRNALRINPHLDGVAETVRALENALGEDGR